MHAVRVATVAEIPPGKGKLVELGGRQVTVYNSGGTYHARCTSLHAPAAPKPAFESECSQPGFRFDAFAEDSPARLHDEQPCTVRVSGNEIFVELP